MSALERVGNPDLVKAALDKPRVKPLSSVARKAKEKGWSVEETIERCWDFVGFRVVCNNLQDVSRAADLFQRALEKNGIKSQRHDYIAKPLSTGYRGIHITFSVKVGFGADDIPVRPQVDAWVLDWVTREPLKRDWFFEQRDGNCRLMGPFAARLAETAPTWGRAVAPLAEWGHSCPLVNHHEARSADLSCHTSHAASQA